MSNEQGRKVLHVTPEMAPFAKQGGLGDVLGALPKAQRRQKLDVRVLLPAWPGVMEHVESSGFPCRRLPERIHIALDWRVYSADILEVDADGLTIYLLEQPELFDNPDIYPDAMSQASVMPFVFHSLAALELPGVCGWNPDILHVHDWTAAILPVALRWHRHYRTMRAAYDVVLTIHNPAHQGIVDPSMLLSWGLAKEAFSIEGMEYYGEANILKGGAIVADAITTVSPRFSWDIQTTDGGFGLDGVFTKLRAKLSGILNGIDYEVWNPRTDTLLPENYGPGDMAGKAACRKKLIEMCGWRDDGKPLVAFIGRLVQQKGVDILFTALDWLLVDNCKAVVIGSGLPQYEDWAQQFRRSYPDYFWCYTGFSEEMAHLIYAGADILAMPSLFEPCGLSQMIAMAYGTVPVVRNTGGLADTVIDFDASADGTGFLFSEYATDELLQAMYRSIEAYGDKPRWEKIVANCMQADFSWDASSDAYENLYRNLTSGDFTA
jgi:glycogen/starch synthases, ADP-glucose type